MARNLVQLTRQHMPYKMKMAIKFKLLSLLYNDGKYRQKMFPNFTQIYAIEAVYPNFMAHDCF